MIFASKWIRTLRHAAFGAALALLCLVTTTASALSPGVSSNRFLFIVDTSDTPKKSAEPLRQTLFDMIYSGVRGHMTNGDSYGVWLSGGGTDTSGGVEVWRDKFAVELASRATLRVKENGLKGRPSLSDAIAAAKRVASSVGDVTVIVITDGSTPIVGSPFDNEINSRISTVSAGIKEIKGTVNAVLAAQDGEFVAWEVNSADFLISMPSLPPRKPRPEVAAAPAPPPAATTSQGPRTAASARRQPVTSSKPIVITKETVERDRQITRAMATTTDPEPPTVNTNTAARQSEVITNVTASGSPVLGNAVPPVVPAQAITSNASVTPAPLSGTSNPIPLSAEDLAPDPQKAAVERGHAASALVSIRSPLVPAQGVQPGNGRWNQKLLWAAGGAAGLASLILLAWFLFRDRRTTSLISRAAALERAQEPR